MKNKNIIISVNYRIFLCLLDWLQMITIAKMSYRYSHFERAFRTFYRRFNPVPNSPWTSGPVADICAVNLVPPENLIRFFENSIRMLHNIKGGVVGDYLEFGVFNGNSIGSMYTARQNLSVNATRLFGFDAFEGLPASAEAEDDGVWKKGFYSCSFEQMQQCLSKRGIDPNNIKWIKGWYDQTLTWETVARLTLQDAGIVFIDCDTYSSSKTALNFIRPLITRATIVCLDDWKLNDLDIKGMGEYQSFNEFLENNKDLKATKIKSYNRKSRSFLIQPH